MFVCVCVCIQSFAAAVSSLERELEISPVNGAAVAALLATVCRQDEAS